MNFKSLFNKEKVTIYIFTLLFLVLSFFVIKELFILICISFLLCALTFPIYKKLNKKIENKRVCSFLTITIILFLLIVPLFLIGYFFVVNVLEKIVQYSDIFSNEVLLQNFLNETMERMGNFAFLNMINIEELIRNLLSNLLNFLLNIVKSIPKILINLFIILFISYHVFIEKEDIFKFLIKSIPVANKKIENIFSEIKTSLSVLFKGYFLTALIQAIVATIGYIIFQMPSIIILSFLSFILCIIPYVGVPILTIPLGVYFIIQGNYFSGIGIILYSMLIVSTIDNFLRPILMNDKGRTHSLLIFISMWGGFFLMGVIGILVGPIVTSITTILLIHTREEINVNINKDLDIDKVKIKKI